MRRLLFNTIILVFFHSGGFSQESTSIEKFKLPERKWSRNSSEQLTQIAKLFLGKPYVASTLEGSPERLVVNLEEFDCTTFVESVLSLHRTMSGKDYDSTTFANKLLELRYRDGNLENYYSRLHYFTEWIADNEEKGIVKNVTKEIGGVPYVKKIDFMSSHSGSYSLGSDTDFVQRMQYIEMGLNTVKQYYIPKSKVASVSSKIQSGDIIAITTSIKGLDVVHTGFAYRDENTGKLHLLHASSDYKKVMISKKTLHDYLQVNRSQSGIIVSRVVTK